jgi:prophage antirepressor-like protein
MSENNIKVFDFEDNKVRTVLIDNEPYFVGKDVASILGYKDINRAVKQHVDKEDINPLSHKAYGDLYTSLWSNKNDFMDKVVINESGVYSLIISSKLPSAKKFKHWVTQEVLPSIRKHGMYATPETLDKLIDNPDFGIKLLKQLKKEREEKKVLSDKIKADQPKVDYYQKYLDSNSTVPISVVAKHLNMTAVGLNKLLQDQGIQFKRGKTWYLTKAYNNEDYATLISGVNTDTGWGYTILRWKPKGIQLIEKLVKDTNNKQVVKSEIEVN